LAAPAKPPAHATGALATGCFFSGLSILFVMIIPFMLFPLTASTAHLSDLPCNDLRIWREHANHLHVTLGAVILGGQFFLRIGSIKPLIDGFPTYWCWLLRGLNLDAG
jgi:hypothetical protein